MIKSDISLVDLLAAEEIAKNTYYTAKRGNDKEKTASKLKAYKAIQEEKYFRYNQILECLL